MSKPTTTLPAEAPAWIDFPEDRIETPYGEMRVIFNGEIMFDSLPNEEHGGPVINRVRYYGSIHLTEINGTWGYMPDQQGGSSRYHGVYLTRTNWTSFNESGLSEAAGKKIDKLVTDVLIPYALSHKEQIEQGRKAQATHNLYRIYQDLERARADLAAVEAKAAEAWKQYEGK